MESTAARPGRLIVALSGMTDEPQPRLNKRTPLQAARTPELDRLAVIGQLGLLDTCPSRFEPGSDICQMTLLGYDPATYYTGRAPLEALANGVDLGPHDLAFRCNLITAYDDEIADPRGGGLSDSESDVLYGALQDALRGDGIEIYPGRAGRALLVVHDLCEPKLSTTAPHKVGNGKLSSCLPRGRGSERLREAILRSREVLEGHDVNMTRRDLGENPANLMWLWGQGRAVRLPSFEERFGVRGAAIAACETARGLALAVGWNLIDVPGATGGPDTNYAGKAAAAIAALDDHPLVYLHVAALDTVSHTGSLQAKLKALEAIDRELIGPLHDGLIDRRNTRLAVVCTHGTAINSGHHLRAPTPFAVAGSGVQSAGRREFSEKAAQRSRVRVRRGASWLSALLAA